MNGDDQIAPVKLIVAGADFLSQHGATQENKLIGAVNDLAHQANRTWKIVGAGEGADVKVDGGTVVLDMKLTDTDALPDGFEPRTVRIVLNGQTGYMQVIGTVPVIDNL